MKIKLGFVTNSSSTCYVLDKRLLTDEELSLIRENDFLQPPVRQGSGRGSAYGEGKAVEKFLDWLIEDDAYWISKYDREWGNPLTELLQSWLAQIGDNVIFIRSSDEQIGGEVLYEHLIAEKAVAEEEYH